MKSKLTQNPTLRYGRGSNRSGFRGLPGGRIDHTGYFHELGSQALWWSTTDYYEVFLNFTHLNSVVNQQHYLLYYVVYD